MKRFLLILLIIPYLVQAQNKVSQNIKFSKDDSMKVVVDIPVTTKSNIIVDSLMLKTIINEFHEKNKKGFWEVIQGILSTLILPIIIGYLGYKYTRSQGISNARIEWIKNFRPLTSKFITGIMKTQTSLQELDETVTELLNVRNSINAIKNDLEDLSTLQTNSTPNNPNRKEGLIEIEKKKAEIEKLELNKSDLQKKSEEKYEKYKIDYFELSQLSNEILISLDPKRYETHYLLSIKIKELLKYVYENETNTFDNLAEEIRLDIIKVIAEQWRIAEGT